MNLTHEQLRIVQYVNTVTDGSITLVNSVSGSGKTSLLTEIAKVIRKRDLSIGLDLTGIYLAYNKAIAEEASHKFPKDVKCSTIHSMAYQNTVKLLGLKVGTFTVRDVGNHKGLQFKDKYVVVDELRTFCLSKYTSFDVYAKEKNIPKYVISIVKHYLNEMQVGKIPCTHDFYLKIYHILLDSGDIKHNTFSGVYLDEAGDTNEVTLEIFKLLPARMKVAVGDSCQNIYSFNDTINAFKVMEDSATSFNMTTSFRVSKDIAFRVESFLHKYIDPNMSFKGVDVDKNDIKTTGYITRTNAALISKMVEMKQEGVPFSLTRKASEIFKVPLILINMKYQGDILDNEFKYLQNTYDEWHEMDKEHPDRIKHRTPLSYINFKHNDDRNIESSFNLITKLGNKIIMDTYYYCKDHEKDKYPITLATGHSSKGLEFDRVIIDSSMNNAISDIVAAKIANSDFEPSEEQHTELLLYYVACTRAKKDLVGAIYL